MRLSRKQLARTAATLSLLALIGTSTLRADIGTCNGVNISVPFTDVAGNIFFCQIAEAYFSGLTNGTSASTYSPHDSVPREQMAAFITRTLDQALKRGSRRAALNQWWTQQFVSSSALTSVSDGPLAVLADGRDIWVGSDPGNTVARVRASDGKVIETWTGVVSPRALLRANGRIYVAGGQSQGTLYAIDPDQPAGNATSVAPIGEYPSAIAFDGEHIITANGSSITNYHTPSGTKTTYTAGFDHPSGALYDGDAFWITDEGDNKLKKVHVNGTILQVVNVGTSPGKPIFDGVNIWVPNVADDSVTVVRASTGAVLATLTGNGMNGPSAAAFDGERILVTNHLANSVSLWQATDLAPLGSFSTGAGTNPFAACSDGINFWVTLPGTDKLARY